MSNVLSSDCWSFRVLSAAVDRQFTAGNLDFSVLIANFIGTDALSLSVVVAITVKFQSDKSRTSFYGF